MKCDIPFYVEYSDYLYYLHCLGKRGVTYELSDIIFMFATESKPPQRVTELIFPG